MTHNHPFNEQREQFGIEQNSAFSPADIRTAYNNGITEVRMIIGNQTHSFSWNSDTSAYRARDFVNMVESETARANRRIQTATTRAQNQINRGANVNSTIRTMYQNQNRAINDLNSIFESESHQSLFGFAYRKGRT
ncbi:MAG: hypothetical protein FWH07_08070 [Oscillospiraceae bacterium]|nr:hypothetical protein [Oscillospiraceae bacterium]